jgi:hypothetical protein
MPLYQLLYEGEKPPSAPIPDPRNGYEWGASGRSARYLAKLCRALFAMPSDDRELMLYVLKRMVSRKRRSALSSSA